MPKILVTYYSRSGHTRKMAEIVLTGAQEEGGVEAELKPVEQVGVEELLQADGIAIGSPTYYGTMAWPVKKLLDESVKFHGKLEGKVGAAFSSSANVGGGNETTVLGILKSMLIHGMVIFGDPSGDHYGPVAIGAPDDRAGKNCLQLGRKLARMVKVLAAQR